VAARVAWRVFELAALQKAYREKFVPRVAERAFGPPVCKAGARWEWPNGKIMLAFDTVFRYKIKKDIFKAARFFYAVAYPVRALVCGLK